MTVAIEAPEKGGLATYRWEACRRDLRSAPDPGAVVRRLRECVESFLRTTPAVLPEAAQEILNDPDRDIGAAAVTLLQVEGRFVGDEDRARLLHELAQTYVAASARMVYLTSRTVRLTLP